MTPVATQTITALAFLICGVVLLVVGALTGNESIADKGWTLALVGATYAGAKGLAHRKAKP